MFAGLRMNPAGWKFSAEESTFFFGKEEKYQNIICKSNVRQTHQLVTQLPCSSHVSSFLLPKCVSETCMPNWAAQFGHASNLEVQPCRGCPVYKVRVIHRSARNCQCTIRAANKMPHTGVTA